MNIDPQTALKHWSKWAVDNGSWRQCCYSIEGRFATDKSRYHWPVDDENAARRLNRYDQRIGEQVEEIVRKMPDQERNVLRARFVIFPHLSDEILARRSGVGARQFDTILLAAQMRFSRAWREQHRDAA